MPSSFQVKLQQALEHLRVFSQFEDRWIPENVAYRSEPTEGDSFVLYGRSIVTPPPELSVIAGDVLHNLRSTIDHLFFALAVKHTKSLTAEQARSCQFPIDQKPREFLNRAACKLIGPGALAVIKTLQPFPSPGQSENQLLRLQELSNIDKHRSIHMAVATNVGFKVDPTRFKNCEIDGIPVIYGVSLATEEQVVATFRIKRRAEGIEAAFQIEPLITTAFAEGVASGKSVHNALANIGSHVENDVVGKLSKFL